MKKILTVLGAHPQFIKASVVSHAIRVSGQLHEVVVHTGQHFDPNMSDLFFNELEMSKPDYFLAISGGPHGSMTGRMLEKIEEVLLAEKPDAGLVYGDTNSTPAGALAAVKLHTSVAHVEAGLRSFNMAMPEEVNPILTDRIFRWLFTHTFVASANLQAEGFSEAQLGVAPGSYVLATVHRAENVDHQQRML
jgi:UDP-GlcNAc3NAcA epimerase